MTNKSISQLTAGAAVASTDIFPDVQTVGVGPVKVTAAQIGEYVLTGSGLTGILPVARGGTGLSTMTAANNALYSTSSSALAAGTLPTAAGGTGLTTFTAANNAIYSSSSSALTAGTLPVAAGGTGLTSLTAGYIPFGNGTSAFGNSSNLFWDNANTRLGLYTSTPTVLLDAGGLTATMSNGLTNSVLFAGFGGASFGGVVAGAGVSGNSPFIAASKDGSGNGLPLLIFTNGSERMRIDSSGNVGIGAVPSNPLQLYRSTTAQTAMLQIEQAGSGSSTLGFLRTASYAWLMGQYSADASFRIAASGADLNTSVRFAIDTSGNVGIGALASFAKLYVDQSAQANVAYFKNTNASWAADIQLEYIQSSVTKGSMLLSCRDNGDVWVKSAYSTGSMLFMTAGSNERMRIDSSGNVVINTAAIATNATDGFLYVPTCAGTPTGTPTTYTGRAPIVVNTTNNKLYFYSGGAWRDAGP